MNGKEFTVSEVVDHLGVNGHTWLMFFLMIFAMIFDGYDFMVVNTTNLFVAHTFWPDNPNPGALMGSLTTWGLLGMVLGGAVGGILSDKIGRKKMLTIAVLWSVHPAPGFRERPRVLRSIPPDRRFRRRLLHPHRHHRVL